MCIVVSNLPATTIPIRQAKKVRQQKMKVKKVVV